MRLSELTTENGLDVLCELTPYIANIATCEALNKELRVLANTPKASIKSSLQQVVFGADMFSRLIPILLKDRRADVYGILSILNEKDIEEIQTQNILFTISEIRELFRDEDLVNFFKSFVGTKPKE